MTQEVGRLQKERQALEQQIAELFAFFAKQRAEMVCAFCSSYAASDGESRSRSISSASASRSNNRDKSLIASQKIDLYQLRADLEVPGVLVHRMVDDYLTF